MKDLQKTNKPHYPCSPALDVVFFFFLFVSAREAARTSAAAHDCRFRAYMHVKPRLTHRVHGDSCEHDSWWRLQFRQEIVRVAFGSRGRRCLATPPLLLRLLLADACSSAAMVRSAAARRFSRAWYMPMATAEESGASGSHAPKSVSHSEPVSASYRNASSACCCCEPVSKSSKNIGTTAGAAPDSPIAYVWVC